MEKSVSFFWLPLLLLSHLCANCWSLGSIISPRHFSYRIVSKLDHSPKYFTQGFVFRENDGALCEGTGGDASEIIIYGMNAKSIPTAPILTAKLASSDFGEGVTSYQGSFYQSTWKSKRVHVYDSKTLERVDTKKTPDELTEGWGITVSPGHDALIMSEGSAWLFWVVPHAESKGFSTIKKVLVRDCGQNGTLVPGLNELELVPLNVTHPERVSQLHACQGPPEVLVNNTIPADSPSGGLVWGNIYGTQCIVAADPASGMALAYIHLDGLNPKSNGHVQVTNGIAYRAGDGNLVWVTGKNWRHMFQIELVPLAQPPKDFPNKCSTEWMAGRGVWPKVQVNLEDNYCVKR